MKNAVIYEQSSVAILARVRRVGSTEYLNKSTASSVTVKTYNASTLELVTTESMTVNSVVYDSLQTDSRWREDEEGYNLAIPLGPTHFPDGSSNYQIEITIVPTDGFDIRFAVEVRTKNLLSV